MMLNREKDRLIFGGTHIIPFLIKEGNEIFLSNKADRKSYNEFVDQRNNLFFKSKDIYDWFEANY
jgi:hypothetical protein